MRTRKSHDVRGTPNDVRGTPNDVRGTPKMYVGHPNDVRGTFKVILRHFNEYITLKNVRGTFKVILRHFKKYISLKDVRGTLGKTPPHLYAPTVRKSTLEDQLISKVNYTCIKKNSAIHLLFAII